jgi:hypothetical protein
MLDYVLCGKKFFCHQPLRCLGVYQKRFTTENNENNENNEK